MSRFDLVAARKIVVTGGAGFLGRRVVDELVAAGARREAILVPRSRTDDLRLMETCLRVTQGADLVMHLAAKVGGIGFNRSYPGELFFDNATMGIHMIEACRRNNVAKVVVAGTICAYPRFTPTPFKEENLWNGYPEETNAPYGVAKKSLLVMLQSYRDQYGMNGLFLLPVNLYGPHDNFDLESSHVIPALIRKFLEARDSGADQVTLWGDGSPTREFLYVDDAARALVLGAQIYNSSDPVNLGSSEEIRIKDLAELIQKKVGFRGKIHWDTSRPNGQERRKLDVTRAAERLGFRSEIALAEGLDRTIRWWEESRSR